MGNKVEMTLGEIVVKHPTPQIYGKQYTYTVTQRTTKAKIFTNTVYSGKIPVVTVNGTALPSKDYNLIVNVGDNFGVYLTNEFDLELNVGDTVYIEQHPSSKSYAPVMICY